MYHYKDFLFRAIDENCGFQTNTSGSIFNPGIILDNKELLFAYRTGNTFWLPTSICVGKLDSQLNPVSKFGTIGIGLDTNKYSIENPVFFRFNDEVYIQVSLVERSGKNLVSLRVAIAKYSNLILQILTYTNKVTKYDNNWVFFGYEDKLYCSYSKHGGYHCVCEINGGNATLKYITEYQSINEAVNNITGCSNLILKDDMLWGVGFVNSCNNTDQEHMQTKYEAIFYAIDPKPPFKIKLIQSEPMLTNTAGYFVEPRKTLVYSVYPSGLMLEKNENWIVAAGINDKSTAFMRIPHSVVLETIEKC